MSSARRSRSWSHTAHTSHEIKKLGNLKSFAGMPADFPNKNSGSLFQSLQICNRVPLVRKSFRALITADHDQRGSGTCVLEDVFKFKMRV
jgi:hypothetical protein